MLNSTTILAIDDDENNLELISEFLSIEGYKIITAKDGIEAIELLREKNHELNIQTIILDWMMPRMDGIEVLEWLKKQEALKKIPVIMQTAKASVENVVEGLDRGVYQYLTKPFREEVLLSMVRSAVEERKRFESLTQNENKKLQDLREHAIKVINKKNQNIEQLNEHAQTQHLINQFLTKSFDCSTTKELAQLLLQILQKFVPPTSNQKNLSCSIYFQAEHFFESTTCTLQKFSQMVLDKSLTEGQIIQGGTYTAVPSKNKIAAILVHNTPKKEEQIVIQFCLTLLEKFEFRLQHFYSLEENNSSQQNLPEELLYLSSKLESLQDILSNTQQQMVLLNSMPETVIQELENFTEIQKAQIHHILENKVKLVLKSGSELQITDDIIVSIINRLKQASLN
ncbi:MAG: DNA-binding response OmpR family regulator [bacterium]|jgi:DNA-binding response OmpR family regulator